MKRFFMVSLMTMTLSLSLNAQEHTRPPDLPGSTSSGTPRQPPTLLSNWVNYTSAAGRFTVLMPEKPTETVENKQAEFGPYTLHAFVTRDPNTFYFLAWVDYAPSFRFNNQRELELNRDNFVKGMKGTLVSSRLLTIDGYQALEFVADTTERTFRSRIYIVGRRPYQLIVGARKGQMDSEAVSRFFTSFKVRPL